jgi:hypothetical protein
VLDEVTNRCLTKLVKLYCNQPKKRRFRRKRGRQHINSLFLPIRGLRRCNVGDTVLMFHHRLLLFSNQPKLVPFLAHDPKIPTSSSRNSDMVLRLGSKILCWLQGEALLPSISSHFTFSVNFLNSRVVVLRNTSIAPLTLWWFTCCDYWGVM